MSYRLSFAAQGSHTKRPGKYHVGGECPKGVSSSVHSKCGMRLFLVNGKRVRANTIDDIYREHGRTNVRVLGG